MKISANELRIGNLLQWGDGEITVDLNVLRDFDVYVINGLEPIPLTEEWLIRVGFEKQDSGYKINHPDYCEWYQRDFPVIGELCQSSDKEYLYDTDTDILRINSVHQLQNLIFALTGEELIQKP